jgi:hypothetical protein
MLETRLFTGFRTLFSGELWGRLGALFDRMAEGEGFQQLP